VTLLQLNVSGATLLHLLVAFQPDSPVAGALVARVESWFTVCPTGQCRMSVAAPLVLGDGDRSRLDALTRSSSVRAGHAVPHQRVESQVQALDPR
jgi:hypothetical protein